MAKTKGQLFSKIDYLFLDIQSQYSEIKKSGEIDVVEVTLLEANLASLAKYIEALKIQAQTIQNVETNKSFFTPPTEIKKPVDDTQEVFEEIEVELPKAPVLSEVPKQSTFAFDTKDRTPIVPKEENPIESADEVVPLIESTSLIEQEVEEVVIPVTIPAQEIEVPVATTPVAVEEMQARPLSINELIKQQKQAGVNVTQQFQTSNAKEKVLDLKTAVSLNDKLLYIKDLFNGYSLAYSEAIELLNRFDSFSEADAFLQTNYALKNGWAEKSQTVDKFYLLLHKKFDI